MYRNTKSRFNGNRRPVSFSRGRRSSSQAVNSSLYVNKAVELIDQVQEPITHQFKDFSLNSIILERVTARGYTVPTPIQDKTIPLIIAGRDVIGMADTGTGKTAAFLLPLINKCLISPTEKTLVIVPTRELAVQISDELQAFTRGMKIFSALCVGGAGYGSQIQALRNRPQFVIGTPGRLKDHLNKGTLRLDETTNLVLDEADRMVEMGFINDVRFLIAALPTARQSLFFSATITPEVKQLIGKFTQNPEFVSVKSRDTSQNVEQDIIRFTDPFHKMNLLHNLLAQPEFEKVLIFGRTKHGVERLSQILAERGFNAVSIHGNKNQSQRQRALNEFKNNQVQILVATDVAARGLDIPNVSHVVNYDVPENYSDYIHRIGRTGRANNAGKALTFVGFGA